MAKMTAVDFIIEKLAENGVLRNSDIFMAKYKEKIQIMNAWNDVGTDGVTTAEQYYNENFKSK